MDQWFSAWAIVQKPLDELLSLTTFAGINDDLCDRFKFQMRKNAKEMHPKLYASFKEKYSLDTIAINSGVLVIPTKLITKNSYQELIDLSKKYLFLFRFPDQGILNLFFYTLQIL